VSWDHDALAADLAGYLRGTRDRMVWTDMQMGPVGSPRPDVYSLAKSYSSFLPLAYEVKISVADFRRDVTAGKWQSYLKYAAGVIFAAPAGLLKKEDIPAGCGLLVRSDAGWRAQRGPTLRAIDNMPRDAWMKLLIDGINRQHVQLEPRAFDRWIAVEKLAKKYGKEFGQILHARDDALESLKAATEAAKRSADDLYAEERENRMRARERVDKELGEARAAQDHLARFLGLRPGAPLWQISRAVTDLMERLSIDGEIQRLQTVLASIQQQAGQGLVQTKVVEVMAPE
jgi:hypothetical protein